MFLGMPGLNGDSYSASQVRWPMSPWVGHSQTRFPSLHDLEFSSFEPSHCVMLSFATCRWNHSDTQWGQGATGITSGEARCTALGK